MSRGYREWKEDLKEFNRDHPCLFMLTNSTDSEFEQMYVQPYSRKDMCMKTYRRLKKLEHRRFDEHRKRLRNDYSREPWDEEIKLCNDEYTYHYWQFTTRFEKGRKRHGADEGW